MKKSKRLQQVSQIAEHREDEAGRQLVQSRQTVEQHQSQLEQLEEFRAHYTKEYETVGSEGINVRQLSDFRLFLRNIDGAIKAQQFTVESCEEQLDQHQREWVETYQRVKALSKVVETQQAHERREEARQEQIETDELALRVDRKGWD